MLNERLKIKSLSIMNRQEMKDAMLYAGLDFGSVNTPADEFFQDTQYSILYFELVYSMCLYFDEKRDTLKDLNVQQIMDLTGIVKDKLNEKIVSITKISDQSVTANIVKNFSYCYKYTTVKDFFKKNYKKFLPNFDIEEIESDEQRLMLLRSFMTEFDKLVEVLDSAKYQFDIESARNDYMYYLSELIGNTRDESLTDDGFREFAKFIIDIYKIKGSVYSFELYFNLLGFSLNIQEFWFDKRLNDQRFSYGTEKKFKDKSDFRFFLSEKKPTDYIPNGLNKSDFVREEEIEEPKNLMYYNHLYLGGKRDENGNLVLDENGNPEIIQTDAGRAKIFLPKSQGGYGFTYFKTNFVVYEIDKDGLPLFSSDTSGSTSVLGKYIEFLTPIFIKYNTFFVQPPFVEQFGMKLKDFYDFKYTQLPIDIMPNLYDDKMFFKINPKGFFEAFSWLMNDAATNNVSSPNLKDLIRSRLLDSKLVDYSQSKYDNILFRLNDVAFEVITDYTQSKSASISDYSIDVDSFGKMLSAIFRLKDFNITDYFQTTNNDVNLYQKDTGYISYLKGYSDFSTTGIPTFYDYQLEQLGLIYEEVYEGNTYYVADKNIDDHLIFKDVVRSRSF